MAEKTKSLTEQEFKNEVNDFFAAVDQQIEHGIKWKNNNYKQLVKAIKNSVVANEEYAEKYNIDFDSKTLLAFLSKYSLAKWGLNTSENNDKAKKLKLALEDTINSIEHEEFRKNLSTWPNEIEKIVNDKNNERIAYTDIANGPISKSFKAYLQKHKLFYNYFRKHTLKPSGNSIYTEILFTIMESYYPEFNPKEYKTKMENIRQEINKCYNEKT